MSKFALFTAWLWCLLPIGSQRTLAEDFSGKHHDDPGELILNGMAFDPLVHLYGVRMNVETYESMAPRHHPMEPPSRSYGLLEYLADLARDHNAPPRIKSALAAALPHARIDSDPQGNLLIVDRNPMLAKVSPMNAQVTVKNFEGQLSKLFKDLEKQNIRLSVFVDPLEKSNANTDVEVTIDAYAGSVRGLLMQVLSQHGKSASYHAVTFSMGDDYVGTQISIFGCSN